MRPFSTYAARRPGITAALVLCLFALWFTVPPLLANPVDLTGGMTLIDPVNLRPLIVAEVIANAVLLGLVGLLGWGHFTQLRGRSDPAGLRLALWYILPGIVLVGVLWVGLALEYQRVFMTPHMLSIIGLSLLIGLFEETLFRGVLMTALRQRVGPGWATLGSGVLFGAFHGVNALAGQAVGATLYQMVGTIGIGLFLAAITVQARSLWPAIILHALWDALALSVLLGARLSDDPAVSVIGAPGMQTLVVPLILTFAAWRIYRRWERRMARDAARSVVAN